VSIYNTTMRISNTFRRCNVITIDQRTGQLKEPEPLRTLATYRSEGAAVTFGQHALVETPGTITVGDRVNVLARERYKFKECARAK